MASSASAASGVTGGGSIFPSRRPCVISSRSRAMAQRPRRLDDHRRFDVCRATRGRPPRVGSTSLSREARGRRLARSTAGGPPSAFHRSWLRGLRWSCRRALARPRCAAERRHVESVQSRPADGATPPARWRPRRPGPPTACPGSIAAAGAAPASTAARATLADEIRRRGRSTGSARARRRAPRAAAPGCRAAAGTPRSSPRCTRRGRLELRAGGVGGYRRPESFARHVSLSASAARARNSRDFTVPSGMPSSCATSRTSCPCSAERMITARSFSGRASTAFHSSAERSAARASSSTVRWTALRRHAARAPRGGVRHASGRWPAATSPARSRRGTAQAREDRGTAGQARVKASCATSSASSRRRRTPNATRTARFAESRTACLELPLERCVQAHEQSGKVTGGLIHRQTC